MGQLSLLSDLLVSIFFPCSLVLFAAEGFASEEDETIIVIHAWFAQHTDFMGFT